MKFLLLICLVAAGLFASPRCAGSVGPGPTFTDTIPIPPPVEKGAEIEKRSRHGIARYFNIISDKQQRDSLFSKLGRSKTPAPKPDSVLWQEKEDVYRPYRGNIIRYIYYNQLKVFGTQIEDPTVATNKLIRFANGLHYNTRIWAIRQALFFREGDTVNTYKLVDNERYLRNLPFIQDARIYIINTNQNSDSVDLVIVTKDLFEYGGTLRDLSTTRAQATAYNQNLLGGGQRVFLGFRWDSHYSPAWQTGVGYRKSNLGGSFADVDVGYSVLNDRVTVDTGVYERSYYFSINRPLFASWAKFAGGFDAELNTSVNIFNQPDSVYRNYQYHILDGWVGYNFRNQFKNTGYNSSKPNIAVELRRYVMNFNLHPTQDTLRNDPNYNSHHYTLGRIVMFHQDFYKTNYFFGFGRTEDIPLSYNASATFGRDDWVGRRRTYAALEGSKFWLAGKNLINGSAGFGTYFYRGKFEDAVLHLSLDYYSNLFWLRNPKLREFLRIDYLVDMNPVLYKPININKENGLLGYRYSLINGFQRLRMSAQTNYYSPINIYGFKFNFYGQLQAALLSGRDESLFDSKLFSGFTLGCQIRNENLTFNTFQISASLQPYVRTDFPEYAPKTLFVQITSIASLNFNIFAIQAPSAISFR